MMIAEFIWTSPIKHQSLGTHTYLLFDEFIWSSPGGFIFRTFFLFTVMDKTLHTPIFNNSGKLIIFVKTNVDFPQIHFY